MAGKVLCQQLAVASTPGVVNAPPCGRRGAEAWLRRPGAAVQARAKELRLELLNSQRLRAHFEEHPSDLALLRHDKPLSRTAAPAHLKHLPAYLRDAAAMTGASSAGNAGPGGAGPAGHPPTSLQGSCIRLCSLWQSGHSALGWMQTSPFHKPRSVKLCMHCLGVWSTFIAPSEVAPGWVTLTGHWAGCRRAAAEEGAEDGAGDGPAEDGLRARAQARWRCGGSR